MIKISFDETILFFYPSNDGLWVDKGVAQSPTKITISRWDTEAGEEVLKKNGGSMDEGSGYESKFFVVQPFSKLVDGDVTVTMKVDSSSVNIYHSTDYGVTWKEMDDISFDDQQAKFKTQKGKLDKTQDGIVYILTDVPI